MILRFTQFKETIKFRNGINKISNINNAFMKKIFESSNSNIIIIVDLRFCKIFDYVLDKNRLNNSEIFYFNLFEGVIRNQDDQDDQDHRDYIMKEFIYLAIWLNKILGIVYLFIYF